MSRCYGHDDCPMTAGYYFGGGIWVCWLHVLMNEVLAKLAVESGQRLQALPKEEK